jgi:hypothetical protein
MKIRFLRRGSQPTDPEFLEVTPQATPNGLELEPITFRVQRHRRVLIVMWVETQLGVPDESLAKLAFQQLLGESIIIFVSEKGSSWHFTKEPTAVAL